MSNKYNYFTQSHKMPNHTDGKCCGFTHNRKVKNSVNIHVMIHINYHTLSRFGQSLFFLSKQHKHCRRNIINFKLGFLKLVRYEINSFDTNLHK